MTQATFQFDTSFAAGFIRSIDANRTVKDALSDAVSASRPSRRISVTQLVNPRQAFFRRTRPEIRPPPDRVQLMMAGTGFHDVFGRVISTEEYVEQLLEVDGIVGKVDIYEDMPVELKTTGSIPADIFQRRSYFDQLGMYCAMAGSEEGQLLVYRHESYRGGAELKVYQIQFLDLQGIVDEMGRRRDLLKSALEANDPTGLPRCEWYGRSCDYSDFCGCETAGTLSRVVGKRDMSMVARDDIAGRMMGQLAKAPASPSRSGLRLNDLVFPRRASLERSREAAAGGPQDGREADMADLQRRGFWQALAQAIRYSARGESGLVPVQLGSLADRVHIYRDVPTILRMPKRPEMVYRDQLSSEFPHYFDRLGFECAMTGSERGRMIIYYDRTRVPDDKFMVYDVWFAGLDGILAEVKRRLDLLETGADHAELPACPAWMAEYCSFSPKCGC